MAKIKSKPVIRFQFVLGASFSSRLISWWGSSYNGFSHVDSVLSNGDLIGARSDKVGGKPPGVQVRPPNYEKWKRRVVVEIQVAAWQEKAWEKWLKGQVNKPYDKAAILGFILGIPLHDRGHWDCSACGYGSTKAIKLATKCPIPDSSISPNSFFFLCTAGLGGSIVESEGF